MKNIFISLNIMLLLSACTTHEAAFIGAIPGRVVGIPLGMAVTAVDESFKTAGDIVKANSRYNRTNKIRYSKPTEYIRNRQSRTFAYPVEGDMHYYKAEILIKTKGPAQIESMQLLESKNVTDFWQ